jgi:hypothetical protein
VSQYEILFTNNFCFAYLKQTKKQKFQNTGIAIPDIALTTIFFIWAQVAQ